MGSEESGKKMFNLNFSKERSVLDSNYHVGSSFLPPINQDCIKHYGKVPILKIKKDHRNTIDN